MIYFIQEWSNVIGIGHIKIGYSHNPLDRIKSLQGRSPRELHLIGVEAGGRAQEVLLHKRFAHLRVGSSEWFEPEEPLLTYLISALPDWEGWNPDWDSTRFVPSVDPGWLQQAIAYALESGTGERRAS